MKIGIGSGTKTVEMKTLKHFTDATRNPMFSTQVFSVTDAKEHAELLKKLNTTPRPYAVGLLVVSS